jgi:uncharacterized integral membrane protein (TIGR00698 family)
MISSKSFRWTDVCPMLMLPSLMMKRAGANLAGVPVLDAIAAGTQIVPATHAAQLASPGPLIAPTKGMRRILPGLLLATGVALAAHGLTALLAAIGLVAGPMVLSLVLGLLLAQFFAVPAAALPGLDYACRPLLRFAVVLLGLRISLPQVASVGAAGLLAVTAIVVGTMLLGYGISRRLGLSKDLALLLASGHAICGAAAIAAADAVLQAKDKEVTQALTLVTLFGTAVMLLMPMLGACFNLDAEVYGFWVGGSVHEVAQALAAGFARGEACGATAGVVKLVRVAHLVPLGLVLGVVVVRRGNGRVRGRMVVPWFVLGFALVAVVDSAGLVPQQVAGGLRSLGNFTMTVAMASLGCKSSLRDVASAGGRALLAAAGTTIGIALLAFVLAVWLV